MTYHTDGGLSLLNQFRNQMEGLFRGFADSASGWRPDVFALSRPAFPAFNVWETDEAFVAECELPGLAMKEIELVVVGDELTIRGESKPCEIAGAVFHRQERAVGSFSRTLQLPAPIHAEKVRAELKDGVLTITLPKSEAAKPRRIKVEGLGT